MVNMLKPWRWWKNKEENRCIEIWNVSSHCPRRVQPVLVNSECCLPQTETREKSLFLPVIIVNGAAPGCTSMWQCRLEFQHSGFEALVESFSKTLHELSRAKRITHMNSQNESYFHLRRLLHGSEKTPLYSVVIWVCKVAALLVINACGKTEKTLDNILQFLWHSSVCPETVYCCWHPLLTVWQVLQCWQEMAFAPIYPLWGSRHL